MLQETADEVLSWFEANKMNINESKTKELFISKKRPPSTHPPLSINGNLIGRVSIFKLLGVWVSEDLTWNDHMAHMLSHASPNLYYLKQLKRAGLSVDDLVMYYRAMIRSSLEYASPVWNSGLTQKHSEDIERVQKCALKTIFPEAEYELSLQVSSLERLDDRQGKLDSAKFSKIQNPDHRLNRLLPARNENVKQSHHGNPEYPQPKFNNKRFKKNFVISQLYKQQCF